MGRPPSNGAPSFRFNQAEVAQMEAILQKYEGHVPPRDLLVSLANNFSNSTERAGKVIVQMKQVWNWFQNRRYALRSKLGKSPGLPNTTTGARDDVNTARNTASVPQQIPVHSASNVARNLSEPPPMEFEAKSSRDGAWYDVQQFLDTRYMDTSAPEVQVRFTGFGPEEDEWINIKMHVRQRSLPCEASECIVVLPGDLILCFQEGKEQALYFDAHVLDVQRRRHDIRGCRCRFLVRYNHDQSEEIVPLRKICRRPETDYRLQHLHALDEAEAASVPVEPSMPVVDLTSSNTSQITNPNNGTVTIGVENAGPSAPLPAANHAPTPNLVPTFVQASTPSQTPAPTFVVSPTPAPTLVQALTPTPAPTVVQATTLDPASTLVQATTLTPAPTLVQLSNLDSTPSLVPATTLTPTPAIGVESEGPSAPLPAANQAPTPNLVPTVVQASTPANTATPPSVQAPAPAPAPTLVQASILTPTPTLADASMPAPFTISCSDVSQISNLIPTPSLVQASSPVPALVSPSIPAPTLTSVPSPFSASFATTIAETSNDVPKPISVQVLALDTVSASSSPTLIPELMEVECESASTVQVPVPGPTAVDSVNFLAPGSEATPHRNPASPSESDIVPEAKKVKISDQETTALPGRSDPQRAVPGPEGAEKITPVDSAVEGCGIAEAGCDNVTASTADGSSDLTASTEDVKE